LPMALKAGLEVRFLTLTGADKIDPDLLFLERGLVAYEEVKRDALSAMAFACRAVLPAPATASPELKSRAAQTLFDLIAAAESEVARSEFLNEASTHLRLPVAAVQKDFQVFLQRQSRQSAARPSNPAETPSTQNMPAGARTITPEHHLLMLCLHFEHLLVPLSSGLPHDWIDLAQPAGVLLSRFLGEAEHGHWPGRDHLENLLETPEERGLVAALIFTAPVIDDPVKVAIEGLRQLRSRALEPRLRQIELALATSHADSNSDPISLLKARSELHRQLRQPISLAVVV
jgi:DNA primase